MKISKLIFAALLCCVTAGACQKPQPLPDWPWEDPQPQPEPPGPEPPGPEPPGPEPQFKGKPRYIWIDASANFQYFANDSSRITSDLQKVKEMGFTDVIVDVRPTEGCVLFKSSVCPPAVKLAAWVNGRYKFVERTASFDYLQAFINSGHRLGLRVNAAINTFVGGYGGIYGLESVGPIFSGEIPESWATVINAKEGLQSTFYEGVEGTVFLNPVNEDVQNFMLTLIGELASYDLDGIILDRCRFDDNALLSDFSDVTRQKFEKYYGSAVQNWPSDIFKPGATSLPSSMKAIQKAWMSFRVKTIHDFVEKASDKVHSVNAEMRFGCYVGAWYSTYYTSGVNWASPDYNARRSYSWADDDYSKAGFADHCDFMMLGCYAGTTSVYGSGEWTMQGFAKLAKQKIGKDTECSGGPDIGNASGFEQGGQQSVIPQTVDACINAADGYFAFDLCHVRMYDYWNAFKTGIDAYLKTVE
ncbi:MAG: family 10 glycosylhydrolase [Bacteroidales bacterium]|nr:family 10 glycosylhydrolase [Bacteroidales bacterium]